jgi:hypothetical protein
VREEGKVFVPRLECQKKNHSSAAQLECALVDGPLPAFRKIPQFL